MELAGPSGGLVNIHRRCVPSPRPLVVAARCRSARLVGPLSLPALHEKARISGAKGKRHRGEVSPLRSRRAEVACRLSNLGGFVARWCGVTPKLAVVLCSLWSLDSYHTTRPRRSSRPSLTRLALFSRFQHDEQVLVLNPSTLWLPIRGLETPDEPIRRDQRRRRFPIRSASTSAAAPDSLGHVSDREEVPTWARLTLTLV